MTDRTFSKLLGVFLVLLLTATAAACAGAAPPPTPTIRPIARLGDPVFSKPAEQTAAPAAPVPAQPAPPAANTPATEEQTTIPSSDTPGADWPRAASVGSASIGNAYYIWGGGWAKIIGNEVIPTSVEVTGGPIPNIQLVDANEATFGYATHGALYEGWNGLEWANGQKYQNMRTMFPMYASYHHFVAPTNNNIRTLRDLEGKVIGGGPRGGTSDEHGTRRLLDTLSIKPARIVNADFSDLNGMIRDGQIAGYTSVAGLPSAPIVELDTTDDVVIIAPTQQEMDKLIAENPYFAKGVIKAGMYKSVKEDLPTLTIWNSAITHRDTPDDLVYAVVKATFENHEDLVAAHPSASETLAENINVAVVPLHPGAVRYYQEKGIKIDSKMLP